MISFAEMKRIVSGMKKSAIKPSRIMTKAEARRMNRFERKIKSTHRWRVGDEYYELERMR